MSTLNENVTDTVLVVPVDVAALCVGIIDQQKETGTSTFAGATTDYRNQSGYNDAFLGTNVVRSLTAPPLQQLTAGIHLHWAIPEALTKGIARSQTAPQRGSTDQQGNLSFGDVPNRWLVSRLTVSGATVTRKSWVVLSDALNAQPPAGQQAVSLPVLQETPTDQNYQFVGQSQEFTAGWTDPDSESTFLRLTKRRLSAVASGDATFAAFYPNSRSVFGFYDALADVSVPQGGSVNVMYQLTGWYSNPETDPLHAGLTREQLQASFGWTFGGDAADTTVTTSLFNGLVQSISWNPKTTYIVGQPAQQSLNATVALGNSPAEAFAAYFRDALHPDVAFFETLLNAFQNGLLTDFQQPKPDQLAQLQEALHQQTFGSADAGTVYQIVPPEKEQPEDPDLILPLPLAEGLNLLNVYQQEVDDYASYTSRFRWQLFADWYRLMQTQDPDKINALSGLLYAKITGNDPGVEAWPQLQKTTDRLVKQRDAQQQLVQTQLSSLASTLQLKPTAAPRYWQPTEPVAVLATPELQRATRTHAIRAQYDAQGYLPCRLGSQLLTALTVDQQAITTAPFSQAQLPGPNHLPQGSTFGQLLLEACLLNTSAVAALSQQSAATLAAALQSALRGEPQAVYTFTGTVPSAVGVKWWHGNLWQPILASWSVQYYPLQATEQGGQLQNYPANFFTANYAIDQDRGGALEYVGTLDPQAINFSQAPVYQGGAVMSSSAAAAFQRQLDSYLGQHPDPTLQTIADTLAAGGFASQALSGFNGQLLMQEQSLQLNIKSSANNPFNQLTLAVAQIAQGSNTLAPLPNGTFSPIRAGYLKFTATAVDVFGQKRLLNITRTIVSEMLTTAFKGKVEPGIVYLPARLAQPTRLLFRWLAAGGQAIQEMNSHPATSPVCGWFLPNHLDGSLFVYNQEGRALGTLYLTGNQQVVRWQSAPGDNETINQRREEVMALQNARLRDLVQALHTNGAAFFIDFWHAVDHMHNFVDPQNYAQSADLAVLIGRPVAVAEAMLRLDVQSGPALNQSWATVGDEGVTETDNAFSQVRFPVILGDLKQINDGLIGYFLNSATGYDFEHFYTQGAAADSRTGVQKPTPTTITLTAQPAPTNDLGDGTQRVLILMDPRAQVHATTGILPTKVIDIPTDQYADTLSILEMTFLTTPVLQGATGLALPVPVEAGFQWSWVEQTNYANIAGWSVMPDIDYQGGQAVGTYTPQTIREGWLRLNPQLLRFALVNAQGQPAAQAGIANALTLRITNDKPQSLTFEPGQLLPEGQANEGTVFYLHFGRLVPQDAVPNLVLTAAGWRFKALTDARYGNYWVATPLANVVLKAGQRLSFSVSNVQAASLNGRVELYYDYYNVVGLNDGVDSSLVTLVTAPHLTA